MTTIIVTENIKLEFVKHQSCSTGTYNPVVFRKGGEMVRNPATGKLQEAEDKWVHQGLYFSNLPHALRWCAQESLSDGDTIPLEEYITKLSGMWKDSVAKAI